MDVKESIIVSEKNSPVWVSINSVQVAFHTSKPDVVEGDLVEFESLQELINILTCCRAKGNTSKLIQMIELELANRDDDSFDLLNCCYAELDRLTNIEHSYNKKNTWRHMTHFSKEMKSIKDGDNFLFKIGVEDAEPNIFMATATVNTLAERTEFIFKRMFSGIPTLTEYRLDILAGEKEVSIISAEKIGKFHDELIWYGFKSADAIM